MIAKLFGHESWAFSSAADPQAQLSPVGERKAARARNLVRVIPPLRDRIILSCAWPSSFFQWMRFATGTSILKSCRDEDRELGAGAQSIRHASQPAGRPDNNNDAPSFSEYCSEFGTFFAWSVGGRNDWVTEGSNF